MRRLRRWRAALSERDGFTLVEVMVVLIIITIGILPLALVQNRARQEVSEADRYTTAMTVAQEQLEWAKGMGFDGAQPDSGSTGAVQWTTRIDDIDVGLRQIRVTVIFAQGGRPDTLAMASLLSMR